MDGRKPWFRKRYNWSKCMTARTNVMIYVLIYCFASHIAGLSQPQYVYYMLKSTDGANNTNMKAKTNNLTVVNDKCSDTSSKKDNKIQGEASIWNWYISLAGIGIALPVVFFIGPLIDRFGRKPLLLWNTIIMFLSFALKTLVVYQKMSLPYYVIVCGIEGLSGTSFAFYLICHAILADVTTKGKDRSFMMTIYDALLGLGAIFSNIITGYIIQSLGFTYPYLFTSCMLIFLPILVGLTLEDPWTPPKTKSKFSIKSCFIQSFSLFSKKHLGDKLCPFVTYLTIILLRLFSNGGSGSLRTLFLLGQPFCWTSEHIGWFGAGTDFVTYILGAAILKLIHSFCSHLKDEKIIVFGLLSSIVSMVILGCSNKDWMVYVASVAEILKILATPLLKSTLSSMVQPDKQGVLFSTVYIMELACVLVASTVFNNIYQQTVDIYKGLTFFIMAAFSLSGVFLTVGINCKDSNIVEPELIVEKPEVQATDEC